MKKILITIITINQNSIEKVEALAGLLMKKLRITKQPLISKYHKFRNSYKIELEKDTGKKSNHKLITLDIASKIGEPWNVYFDTDNSSIELIFNKTKHSYFTKGEFGNIRWVQILFYSK